MKTCIFLFINILTHFNLQAQLSGKISFDISYGLNGNFFVSTYNDLGGPPNKTNLYNKNFLGTIGGIEIKYNLNDYSSLIVGYSRSVNKGKKNFSGNVNGVDILINDFNISHSNDFYQLGFERRFNKLNPIFKYHLGIVLAQMHQQEISIENFANQIIIEERNFKNSKLQEAGIFAGLQLQKKIDSKFEVGLRIRAYYLVSLSSFEALTLTPTLTYTF